jgi:hypothetical protein
MSTSYLEDIPVEILSQTIKPNDIIGICKLNKTLLNRCSKASFWIDYLYGNQNRFYEVLASSIKDEDWNTFKFLWDSDIGVIKERKFIGKLFKTAVRLGYDYIALKLWNLNPEWMTRRFAPDVEYLSERHTCVRPNYPYY